MKTIVREDIAMYNVESSSISAVGYDDNVLVVRFKNGGTYMYVGVEESQFNNMVNNSKSVGKYFSENIKNCDKYTCIKL